MTRFGRVLLSLALLLMLSPPLHAVGTVNWTVTSQGPQMRAYTAVCVSTAGGACSANTTTINPGQIMQVRIVPGTAGNQPSDLFDVQVQTADGLDLLGGAGANCSNAAPTLAADLAIWTDTTSPTLDVVVAGAGSAKTVTVTILVKI